MSVTLAITGGIKTDIISGTTTGIISGISLPDFSRLGHQLAPALIDFLQALL